MNMLPQNLPHVPGCGCWTCESARALAASCRGTSGTEREIEQLRSHVVTLLAVCKELREALAAAMRTMATDHADADELADAFVSEIARLGIADGVGVRADAAIAKAEGKP